MVKESELVNRWIDNYDAIGRECSPIQLLVLGSLRYLGRGWCFDDLEEVTSISEEIHRVFFHVFITWGSTILYKKFVIMPQQLTDLDEYVREMEAARLHGCIGSVDATHIGMLRCPYGRWNQHKGPKMTGPAQSYNIVVNHKRQILSSAWTSCKME
jgi:hypothetical protein